MIVIPSMEVIGGKCVSLRRGRMEDPMVWHIDPIEKGREFAAGGASWMHLTDIDAIRRSDINRELVIDMIRHVGIPVQLAGGIRTLDAIHEWADLGAGRIVVGTIAALQPDLVRAAAKLHPDQIVVAVDVYQGSVMIHGWNEPSAISPEQLIREYRNTPLAAILVTDIDSNIENRHSSLSLLKSLSKLTRTPVIASGVVRNVEDIRRLRRIRNVEAALIGTALYNRTIDIEDALTAALPLARPRGIPSSTDGQA